MTLRWRVAMGSFILLVIAVTVCFVFAFANLAKSTLAHTSAAQSEVLEDDFDLRSIANTLENLRRIHTSSYDGVIPIPARPLLKALKHQLRYLITNLLRSETAEASTKQLEAILIENLRRVGVTVSEPPYVIIDNNYVDTGYNYGAIYNISIRRPLYCADLIAVTTTIGVLCGEDSSLYVFKYADRAWNLIIASEANDYEDISGAQGAFDYGISVPDERGEFFVVTASVNPWCSSAWQAITYRVLRAGTNPDDGRNLLARTQTIWLIDDPPYKLDVHELGFTLSFHDEKYLEMQNEGKEVSIDDPKGMRTIKYGVLGDALQEKD